MLLSRIRNKNYELWVFPLCVPQAAVKALEIVSGYQLTWDKEHLSVVFLKGVSSFCDSSVLLAALGHKFTEIGNEIIFHTCISFRFPPKFEKLVLGERLICRSCPSLTVVGHHLLVLLPSWCSRREGVVHTQQLFPSLLFKRGINAVFSH